MVLDFYKLREQPFGVTPDPRFLYLSPTHREALASVQYAVSAGRGFTALIARPGMGKTTLLFDFLNNIPIPAKTVFLFQSQPTPKDLLRNLLEDLGIQGNSDDIGYMQRKLNECLVSESKNGKPVIVVIDEAQNLDESVLEVVRMLSNFETSREKLMHLVLAGQPRLSEMLASPRLEQLRQRISIIARLRPFSEEETHLYIDHRLRVAGYGSDASLFTKQALALITENASGIPRNINNLCFNAMSLACAMKAKRIEADAVKEAISDLRLDLQIETPSEGMERNAKSESNVINLSTAESPWLGSWRLKVALPLGLLAFIGAGVAWRRTHSAPFVERPLFTSQASMTSATLPSPSVVTNVSSANPKQFAESESIADSGKSSTVSRPANSNLRSHSSDKDGSGLPRVVTVQPNQTMYQICMETLGRYDDATKTKIRELNPGFINLTQIRPGQRLVLPAREAVRRRILVSADLGRATPEQASSR